MTERAVVDLKRGRGRWYIHVHTHKPQCVHLSSFSGPYSPNCHVNVIVMFVSSAEQCRLLTTPNFLCIKVIFVS